MSDPRQETVRGTYPVSRLRVLAHNRGTRFLERLPQAYGVTVARKFLLSHLHVMEEGLGGRATRLPFGGLQGGAPMSASYNDYLQKYILIFINDEVDEPDQGVYVATSEDGIRWSDPVPVWKVNSQLDKPGKPAVNYPSLIGIGKNSTMETSKENWLLYRYDFPDGSPSIARRALTFDCPGPS